MSSFVDRLDKSLSTARLQIAHTRHRLATGGIIHRPAPPQPTTCCGRGCNGCVWEGWYAAVQYWQEQANELLNAPLKPPSP